MTKVTIHPGACGLVTQVTAESEDQMDVTIHIQSACPGVQKLSEHLDDTLDAFEICLKSPMKNPLYQEAENYLPGHASCPVIAGIIKCIEAECHLAIPTDASITFEK